MEHTINPLILIEQPISGFQILFFLIMGVVFLFILVQLVFSLSETAKTRKSPIITTDSTIKDKKYMVSRENFPVYYLTIETKDGTIEFKVSEKEFDSVFIGDSGVLTYQRKKFKSFVKK